MNAPAAIPQPGHALRLRLELASPSRSSRQSAAQRPFSTETFYGTGGRGRTADATFPRVTIPAVRHPAAEPSEGDFDPFPDLEKPVRGAARRGQTERASMETVSMLRAVMHDLGALELRADDQADSRRQNVDGSLSSRKGAVRLGNASSSGSRVRAAL
jgi:hypothetical protein